MKLAMLKNYIRRLHECERGDIPVGPILIIGIIVIPIVIGLVIFRDDLMSFLNDRMADFMGEDTQQGGYQSQK